MERDGEQLEGSDGGWAADKRVETWKKRRRWRKVAKK